MHEQRESREFYDFVEKYEIDGKSIGEIGRDLNLSEEEMALISKSIAFMRKYKKKMNGSELRRTIEFLQVDPMSEEFTR